MKPQRSGELSGVVRAVVLVDGLVFLAAALFNEGLHVPLGFITLHFAPAVWQAGIGELVVALALLIAAMSGRMLLSWIGFWLSVVGIVVGLSSHQVQGAARDIHVVLVPLAILLLILLIGSRRSNTSLSTPSPQV